MSIQIKINDVSLEVEQGISILQAARQSGIEIPTLCHLPGLPAHGSCRICLVEIKGRKNTPAACSTLVEDGMEVYTHTPRVQALRKDILQMLLSAHPSSCVYCPEKDHCEECMITLRKAGVTTGCGSCPNSGQCDLHNLAEEYGVEIPGLPIRYRMVPVERMDPFFDRDYNLCILCARCVRICEELHFENILSYTTRGAQALVGTAFHQTHLEAGCSFCGACVEVCPTGALSEKTRKWEGGPEGKTSTTCPLCSIGCQIDLLSKKGRVIGSLPNHGAGEDTLCVKGRFGITELVNHHTRLKKPMQRAGTTWLATGWEDAINVAVDRLSACSPDRFGMQVSASCTNEDIFVATKFAREVMCSQNLGSTAQSSYGPGIHIVARLLQQSQPLATVRESSVILALGIEDRYADSVIEFQLRQAKRQGTKLIALGSDRLFWGRYADEWLRSEPGQEANLLHKLVDLVTSDSPLNREPSSLARAARLLRLAGSPAVILGPAVLANPGVLPIVEILVQSLGARVIALPEQVNLSGALQLGLLSGDLAATEQALDVLYLIGEAIPGRLSGEPYVIYQNLYPPATAQSADLLLPAAAFSEDEGTFITAGGQVRAIHPAVRPAGEALPNWLILSRIARAMGAAGFDYTCVEDVQAALRGQAGVAPAPGIQDMPYPCHVDLPGEPVYMGYPLSEWVGGLSVLYPCLAPERDYEPNP